MSSASLLSYTLREAKALGLTVTQLPLWLDIDRAGDLGALARLAGDAPLRGEPLQSLREIYLHVTHRCGRDCRHCYNRDAARDPAELSTQEWIDAIDQCAALGAGSFVFIGGDPLLRADFAQLVDHITGVRGARARFFFNSLVDEDDAAALAKAGRGRLTPLASIDGPREINDALRGPGSYDDVMASIANLRAVGLEPVANTVLVRPVLAGLEQLARELSEARVRRLHLILPHQAGGAGGSDAPDTTRDGRCDSGYDPADLVPTGEELLAAVRGLLAAAAEIGITVDNLSSWRRRIGTRNDLCAAGCRDLAIDPYGQVHACVITAGDPAFNAGSLRKQSLEQIWRASGSLRLLRAARARDRVECLACPVVDACGGECWVQAHYAARAHDEPAGYQAAFPYCDLVRPFLQELAEEAAPAAGPAAASAAVVADPAAAECVAADACGGQAAAGADDYSLFDCI
jgi:radical SAM protein with 4Fe4S-binding SPASM domain